jgi:hypothetical protein
MQLEHGVLIQLDQGFPLGLTHEPTLSLGHRVEDGLFMGLRSTRPLEGRVSAPSGQSRDGDRDGLGDPAERINRGTNAFDRRGCGVHVFDAENV